MYGYTDPISGEYYPPGSGALETVYPEFDAILFGPLLKEGVKLAGDAVWNSTAGQYIRYPIGKIKYGFDAKLPTLYRKLKTRVPVPQQGEVVLTNPHPRFGYRETGETSPTITNFTYDTSVRSHGRGNWDSASTIAVPGKTLFGKRVISTEPSDVFTFGDKVSSKLKNTTILSGDAQEIARAKELGYNVVTNEDVQNAYEIASNIEGDESSSALEKLINLQKSDYSGYAKKLR